MRKDSVSREVLRHEEFNGCVELKRIRDWFICEFVVKQRFASTDVCRFLVTVESEGPYAPERLLPESIKVMREKISSIRQAAQALLADTDGDAPAPPDQTTGDGDVSMADS